MITDPVSVGETRWLRDKHPCGWPACRSPWSSSACTVSSDRTPAGQGLDDLLGRGRGTCRSIAPRMAKQRRAKLIKVRDRRCLLRKGAALLQRTVFAFTVGTPVGGRVLPERQSARDPAHPSDRSIRDRSPGSGGTRSTRSRAPRQPTARPARRVDPAALGAIGVEDLDRSLTPCAEHHRGPIR